MEEPVINGHLQIGKLVLNGEPIGALEADAVTQGRQLQLTARSNFTQASLSLDGTVDLQGDMPAKVNLQFSNIDINPFLPTDPEKSHYPAGLTQWAGAIERSSASNPCC